jgi:hypothetical protein
VNNDLELILKEAIMAQELRIPAKDAVWATGASS